MLRSARSTFALLVLVLVFASTTTASAQVAVAELQNPSCEQADGGNNPPGWDDLVAGDITGQAIGFNQTWRCLNRTGCNTSGPGCFFDNSNRFVSGNDLTGLRQVVDLSAYGTGVPGTAFTFSVQARALSSIRDRGSIQVDFLDAGGAVVGALYQAIDIDPGFTPVTYSATAPAPANTAQVRIAFGCRNLSGSFCDLSYDNVQMTTPAALPVELTGFTARLDGDAAVLAWTTASETNNAGFTVEHARGGAALGGWAEVGFVGGAGTTLEAQTYTYRVGGLAPGAHRFRLRQTDYDGSVSYGPEVEVAVALRGEALVGAVYPAPAHREAAVEVVLRRAQHVEAALYDLLGRRVRRVYAGALEADHTQRIAVETGHLPAGTYLLRVRGEHFAESRPLVVVR